VTDTIDAQGNPQGALDYSPYGETIGEGALPDFRYAGMFQLPETGLYLTHYRLYDPSSKRWLNRDPIGEHGGLNLYAYVGGNPVNYVDPTGELSLPAAAIGTGVVVAAIIINTPEGKKAIGNVLTGIGNAISQMSQAGAGSGTGAGAGSSAGSGAGDTSCPNDDECEEQAKNDEQMCRMTTIPGTGARARCWASVQERYGACRTGSPLPPLVMW
jgi:RHS repeat-associated protein